MINLNKRIKIFNMYIYYISYKKQLLIKLK